MTSPNTISVHAPFAMGASGVQSALATVPTMPTIESVSTAGLMVAVNFVEPVKDAAATASLIMANLTLVPVAQRRVSALRKISEDAEAKIVSGFPFTIPGQPTMFMDSEIPDQVNLIGMVMSQTDWPITVRVVRGGDEVTKVCTATDLGLMFQQGGAWKLQVLGFAGQKKAELAAADTIPAIDAIMTTWEAGLATL